MSSMFCMTVGGMWNLLRTGFFYYSLLLLLYRVACCHVVAMKVAYALVTILIIAEAWAFVEMIFLE